MAKQSKDNTPAMRQYHGFKQRHPDCVLLFRLGDFYEMFYDDAELAHRVLGLTCTRRNGIPMAGVPHHASAGYIEKLPAIAWPYVIRLRMPALPEASYAET